MLWRAGTTVRFVFSPTVPPSGHKTPRLAGWITVNLISVQCTTCLCPCSVPSPQRKQTVFDKTMKGVFEQIWNLVSPFGLQTCLAYLVTPNFFHRSQLHDNSQLLPASTFILLSCVRHYSLPHLVPLHQSSSADGRPDVFIPGTFFKPWATSSWPRWLPFRFGRWPGNQRLVWHLWLW